MKQCSHCKKEKPFEEFYKANRRNGYQPYCIPCSKVIRQKRYNSHRKEEKLKAKKWHNELKYWFRSLKNKLCKDCNQSFHFSAMHFDHKENNKLANVSNLIHRGSKKAILDEISKCDLVCANCHALRTWNRLNGAVA